MHSRDGFAAASSRGLGIEIDPGSQRARALQLSRSAYRETWENRFDRVLMVFRDRVREAEWLVGEKRGRQ